MPLKLLKYLFFLKRRDERKSDTLHWKQTKQQRAMKNRNKKLKQNIILPVN